MANRRNAKGLTIGQLITLTIGFLFVSVIIFFFGLWVGRDLAEQREARDRQVVRVPVAPPEALDATPTRASAVAVATTLMSTTTAMASPTATPELMQTGITPTTHGVPTHAPALAGTWTIQASATNDPVTAVVLARRLRAKGYDAYTAQSPIGGVTWYRVRVGRFKDRASAKVVERRLRSEEGLEAAYVTEQ